MIPVVTEISPILGLTLVEMAEWIAIAIMISATVTGVFSLWSIRQSKSHISKQLKIQIKINSADLSLRMIDVVRREDFREILGKIRDGKSGELKDNEIGKVLNHYEYLAEFEKDDLLNFDHVLHQHGRNIKMLYDDHVVKQQFDEAREKNLEYNYVNLANLFTKINNCID